MNKFIPQNKQQAQETTNLFKNLGSIINLLKLSPEFGSDNEMLDAASDINSLYSPFAETVAKKYNVTNNSYYIPDPIGDIKKDMVENAAQGMKFTADKLYQGGKKALDWSRSVKQSLPEIKNRTLNKIDNDFNIPRKWNEVMNGETFGNIEINPTFSRTIDSNGNVTLHGRVEKSKYKGYRNPLTNDNRIYTREDIGAFKTPEFEKAEPEIMAQWGNIGIPTNEDLEFDRTHNNGTVFVHAYTRRDGVQVKAHYRSA